MAIFDSINDVTSIITLIDYTIRFAKFLSPTVKRVLVDFQKHVSKMENSSTQNNEFEDLLYYSLKGSLPELKVQTTMDDLHCLLPTIQASLKYSNIWMDNNSIPKYSLVLGNLLKEVVKNINNWGCFERWGFNYNDQEWMEQNLFGKIFLPTSIKLSHFHNKSRIAKYVRTDLQNAKFYFVKPELGKESKEIWLTNQLFIKFQQPYSLCYSMLLNRHELKFFGIDVIYLHDPNPYCVNGYVHIKYPQEFSPSQADFEELYSGLLWDLVYYSRLVRGEIDLTTRFINGIRQLFR